MILFHRKIQDHKECHWRTAEQPELTGGSFLQTRAEGKRGLYRTWLAEVHRHCEQQEQGLNLDALSSIISIDSGRVVAKEACS